MSAIMILVSKNSAFLWLKKNEHTPLGRGFIIPYNNKLILKAIYSMGDKDCKNGGNAIFIEISKYSDWIKRIVNINP